MTNLKGYIATGMSLVVLVVLALSTSSGSWAQGSDPVLNADLQTEQTHIEVGLREQVREVTQNEGRTDQFVVTTTTDLADEAEDATGPSKTWYEGMARAGLLALLLSVAAALAVVAALSVSQLNAWGRLPAPLAVVAHLGAGVLVMAAPLVWFVLAPDLAGTAAPVRMTQSTGFYLACVAGALELGSGLVLLGPPIPVEGERRVTVTAMRNIGGSLFILVGLMFIVTGLIEAGNRAVECGGPGQPACSLDWRLVLAPLRLLPVGIGVLLFVTPAVRRLFREAFTGTIQPDAIRDDWDPMAKLDRGDTAELDDEIESGGPSSIHEDPFWHQRFTPLSTGQPKGMASPGPGPMNPGAAAAQMRAHVPGQQAVHPSAPPGGMAATAGQAHQMMAQQHQQQQRQAQVGQAADPNWRQDEQGQWWYWDLGMQQWVVWQG